MAFTVDEIYGVDFDEFCKRTYTTPELFMKAIDAEIAMLEENYDRQSNILRNMRIDEDGRDRQEKLVSEIRRRIKQKKSKRKKYERAMKRLEDGKAKKER